MPFANDHAESLAERLEQGEILTFNPCPFGLPGEYDRAFLLAQRPGGRIHKDITFNPDRESTTGYVLKSVAQAARLHGILRGFAQASADWLSRLFPRYAARWQLDRVSFHTEEEATRKLRLTARNDLLHVDAFPSRPTRGRRILRLFVNINPTDPRVWATSITLDKVFERHGRQLGLTDLRSHRWSWRLGQGLLNLFQPGAAQRTPYDSFMLRLHRFLKTSDNFQERSPRRLWYLPSGSAWLLFSDGVCHADLRGQYAIDQSFFIPQDALALPDASPFALFNRACKSAILSQAA